MPNDPRSSHCFFLTMTLRCCCSSRGMASLSLPFASRFIYFNQRHHRSYSFGHPRTFDRASRQGFLTKNLAAASHHPRSLASQLWSQSERSPIGLPYGSTRYVMRQISQEYVTAQVLVQNGDSLICKRSKNDCYLCREGLRGQ